MRSVSRSSSSAGLTAACSARRESPTAKRWIRLSEGGAGENERADQHARPDQSCPCPPALRRVAPSPAPGGWTGAESTDRGRDVRCDACQGLHRTRRTRAARQRRASPQTNHRDPRGSHHSGGTDRATRSRRAVKPGDRRATVHQPRTVAYHLGKVFSMLNITSHGQLNGCSSPFGGEAAGSGARNPRSYRPFALAASAQNLRRLRRPVNGWCAPRRHGRAQSASTRKRSTTTANPGSGTCWPCCPHRPAAGCRSLSFTPKPRGDPVLCACLLMRQRDGARRPRSPFLWLSRSSWSLSVSRCIKSRESSQKACRRTATLSSNHLTSCCTSRVSAPDSSSLPWRLV